MGPITSLSDLISALRRRFWLIMLITAIGVPLAIWFALSQPRLYEATAVVQIEQAQVAEAATGEGAPLMPDQQLNLIQQQLMSRDNLIALIDRFDLLPQVISVTEQVAILRNAVKIVRLQDPAMAWRPEIHPSGLSVTVRLGERDKVAAVANDLVDTIIAEASTRNANRANRTLEFLVTEEDRISVEIAGVEAEISHFREVNLAALPEGLTAQRDRLTRLTEQRIEVDQAIIELASTSDRLRGDDEARQNDLLLQQRQVLLAALTETEAAIAAAPEVERQLGALNRQLDQLVAELTVITTRRTEAAMTQTLANQDQAERYVVLETAIPPEFPISASRKKIVLAGVMLAGMLALGLSLALEVLNPVIRTAAQLHKELGVQPVIVVPLLTNKGARRRRWIGWLVAFLALLVAGWALFKDRILAALGNMPGLGRSAMVPTMKPVSVTISPKRGNGRGQRIA